MGLSYCEFGRGWHGMGWGNDVYRMVSYPRILRSFCFKKKGKDGMAMGWDETR